MRLLILTKRSLVSIGFCLLIGAATAAIAITSTVRAVQTASTPREIPIYYVETDKKQVALSKVQTNPYRCVLAWFKKQFPNYDEYKDFFAELAKQEAQKKDIFTVVKSSVIIETETDNDEAEDDFDDVANL